jgi:mannose-1-phosphate guanylyltransferase
MIRKCILLAAGLGTRLQPITNNIPKCLVEVHGRPLLEYWLILLQEHGITNVLINTHHLHTQVSDYINSITTPLEITISYEKDLLGSFGTIIHNKDYYKDEESLLVANADNLTNINLSKLIKYHFSHDYEATIALMEATSPSECGIVELGQHDKIISYVEKPTNPKTNIANAGVYVFNTSFLRNLEVKGGLLDIGHDLLPQLIGRSSGYLLDEFLMDIGSHFSLDRARKTPQSLFHTSVNLSA